MLFNYSENSNSNLIFSLKNYHHFNRCISLTQKYYNDIYQYITRFHLEKDDIVSFDDCNCIHLFLNSLHSEWQSICSLMNWIGPWYSSSRNYYLIWLKITQISGILKWNLDFSSFFEFHLIMKRRLIFFE